MQYLPCIVQDADHALITPSRPYTHVKRDGLDIVIPVAGQLTAMEVCVYCVEEVSFLFGSTGARGIMRASTFI